MSLLTDQARAIARAAKPVEAYKSPCCITRQTQKVLWRGVRMSRHNAHVIVTSLRLGWGAHAEIDRIPRLLDDEPETDLMAALELVAEG